MELSIGMATYDDFDGVYFTVQALRLYQDIEDTEILVIDNYGCELTKAFVEAGVPVETIYIPAVDHSFIGATPQATRDATLRATNATFDFFHARLGVPQK